MSGKPIRNVQPIKCSRKNTKISIIIPAAKEGNKMKSFGSRSLLDINNEHLVNYQARILREEYPHSDIILVTGFESDKVMNKADKNIIKIENERYNDTNVLRSIAIGLRAAIYDHVLVVYGDLIFNRQVFDFPIDKSTIVVDGSGFMGESQIGCTIIDDSLENMFYNLGNKWAQVTLLTGKELKLMKTIAFDKSKEKLFGFEACNEILNRGGKFACCSPKGMKIMDVDSYKDIDPHRIKDITC